MAEEVGFSHYVTNSVGSCVGSPSLTAVSLAGTLF